MITILGNIRVNSLTRLEHLKHSFLSFDTVSDDWIINVRGTFREEAISFLRQHLKDKLTLINLLDDSRGWITNSLDMIKHARHEYILVWNEDHLNIAPKDAVVYVVKEMKEHQVDYLTYSWWLLGKSRYLFDKYKKDIGLEDNKNISVVSLTREKWSLLRTKGYPYYLISMCGIFRKEFLQTMLCKDEHRLPLFFKQSIFKCFGLFTKLRLISPYGHKDLFEKINRIFFRNKLRKYPRQTPFEMEKGPERIDILPFKLGISKQELFACIDDNVNEKGYSLVERGLYKSGKNNVILKDYVNDILVEIKTVLSKIDEKQVDSLVKDIVSARKIIASGAGRVGMAVRGFVMRLKHLGLDAYIIGDANVPALKQEDLFLVCSGSGETQTILELVLIAKKNLARVSLITGNRDSRMGKLADSLTEIKAPSKTKPIENFNSIQPMTTLNEQCLSIFFDAVVLKLMHELGETHDTMWARHSNLE